MAEAYEQMTETILHDEAELEDIVHQKEVLLREVHHRVKNNLQLIASIMNMQMRRTKSEEARSIMKGLQDRVMSLATIHRELYQTAGLSDIHTDELLSMIVRQITNMADWPDRRFTVHSTFDDIRLVPDQAVPLALLVSEAVTNALKHAMTGREPSAELWVSLKRTDDSRAELHIRNTTVRPVPGAEETASESSGLGTQLISAFAMQMGGLVRRETEDGFYNLMVSFELRPLSDGEQRSEALERA
jgi:two-component sensor histidine kinase